MTPTAGTASHLEGKSAAGGRAFGPLYRLPGRPAAAQSAMPVIDLAEAIEAARADLARLVRCASGTAAEIIGFQTALLEDPALTERALRLVRQGTASDAAWCNVTDAELDVLLASGSDALRNCAPDLLDIRQRVLAHLYGLPEERTAPSGHVVLADDLAPSEFLSIDWKGGGLVLRQGSPFSHLAALARARGVPMIVAVGSADAPDANYALVDGDRGIAVLQSSMPDTDIYTSPSAPAVTPEAVAADVGTAVMVNISDLQELEHLNRGDCDGIGLVRSEFLLRAPGDIVSEERQLASYRRLLNWAGDLPVRLRTIDAGDDKIVYGLSDGESAAPGMRGLRLSLRRPEIFRVQLRALARAAAEADNLWVMFPMVTTPVEFHEARAIFEREVETLQRRGIAAALPPLGVMIEVPAAALSANLFHDVRFFSIGSNDLFQYTMAIPREDAAVTSLAAVDNPAMTRLIAAVAQAGRERGADVCVCGDVAADPQKTEWLLSCGVSSLSVPPPALEAIRSSVKVFAMQSARGRQE